MKEFPILFSDDMVRANHAGKKRMTRRVVKLPMILTGGETPDHSAVECGYIADNPLLKPAFYAWLAEYPEEGVAPLKCPYGQPGDRLWVRETHRAGIERTDGKVLGLMAYKADGECRHVDFTGVEPLPEIAESRQLWRPSIHMPRWACRDIYTVTKVRIERLQDITEEDARAEGVDVTDFVNGDTFYRDYYDEDNPYNLTTARESFQSLWYSMNHKKPGCRWEDNPWVWVIEYDNPLWGKA